MSVMVATAYMDEAQRFHWLVAMDEGRVLATGRRRSCCCAHRLRLERTPSSPSCPRQKRGHQAVVIPPLQVDDADVAIEAQGLTMRFGDFVAVDHVNFPHPPRRDFRLPRLQRLRQIDDHEDAPACCPPAKAGLAVRQPVDPHDIDTRRRVGYVAGFSLYGELTVRQNLVLHAQLFHVPADHSARVQAMVERFDLQDALDALPEACRWACASACRWPWPWCTSPSCLILDEPTSGVDPIARDRFWQLLADLSRRDRVTIFISTHFMNEAARCDRMSMMHAGRVLDSDRPAALWCQARRGHAGRGLHRLPGRGPAATPGRQTEARRRQKTSAAPQRRARAPLTAPSACSACSATCGARRWSCSATRCAPRWRCWARWC